MRADANSIKKRKTVAPKKKGKALPLRDVEISANPPVTPPVFGPPPLFIQVYGSLYGEACEKKGCIPMMNQKQNTHTKKARTNKVGAKRLWKEAIEVKLTTETKQPWSRLLVATPKAKPPRSTETKERRLVKLKTIGWKTELDNNNPYFEELEHEWLTQLDLDAEGMSLERMKCENGTPCQKK
jgi:hypothetical protein